MPIDPYSFRRPRYRYSEHDGHEHEFTHTDASCVYCGELPENIEPVRAAKRALASAACLGCFSAGEHIAALHDLIRGAAPLGWAAAGDMVAAGEWEKAATDLMERYERTRAGA